MKLNFENYSVAYSIIGTSNNVWLTEPNLTTVETRIKEYVFIGTLRLKFSCSNPLNKNPKRVKRGPLLKNGFHAVKLALHEC